MEIFGTFSEDHPAIMASGCRTWKSEQALVDKSNKIEIFKKIALKHGTDKVTTHHYEYVYGQIVGLIRYEKINFLEIGLGCGMGYGPGKSIPVWKEFMPNATISILEYNEACARPFESQVKHLFVGDQSDLSLMKQIGEFGVFLFIDRTRPFLVI